MNFSFNADCSIDSIIFPSFLPFRKISIAGELSWTGGDYLRFEYLANDFFSFFLFFEV